MKKKRVFIQTKIIKTVPKVIRISLIIKGLYNLYKILYLNVIIINIKKEKEEEEEERQQVRDPMPNLNKLRDE